MRYITLYVLRDLKEKMVFIAGPRQCGKTTIAKSLLSQYKKAVYFNCDNSEDKKKILKKQWSDDEELIVFDELHKYHRWKQWLKGPFDVEKFQKGEKACKFLVTGSARLDVYRRGGDSMLGRYWLWRLHPFCLAELPKNITLAEGLHRLLTVGGFPEPFLKNDQTFHARWRKERFDLVIREDLRDLEKVHEIQQISLLAELLRERVSSLVVVNNLAEDIQAAPQTIQRWIELLERMFLLFIVRPYTKSLPRAIRKPPKIYFYDNADVINNDGARFENLVATHLLKRCHFLENSLGETYELQYLKDKDKREIDFVITKDRKIDILLEAKVSDETISPHLKYYAERLKPRLAIQLVKDLKRPFVKNNIHVLPVSWLAQPLDNGFTLEK